jgi:beta-fructofuranosidase
MIFLRRLQAWLVFVFFLFAISAGAQTTNEAVARADASMAAGEARADADPTHPIFHITSPSEWMNDPNGPIYYHRVYHVFYQLGPFSDAGGPRYWGHVRSRDLVKWERLPVALWPSTEKGEAEVWSGCCTTNGQGEPMAFYTSIATGTSAGDHAEQWAAIGDKNLITWKKPPENPVLSETLHGGKKIYDWRDPFIFHDQGRAFLVTGGNLNHAQGGQATVNIYEAQNADLTRWKYRGVLFQHPDPQVRTAECPNFFKVGNEWMLVMSPYGRVQYFLGDFDLATCRFQARTNGFLDYGPNFYAPNTMQVPDGRRILWGWVTGWPNGRGWNGCLSLPRLLTVHDGTLHQNPAPQLEKLRGKMVEWRNMRLDQTNQPLKLPPTNTLEILADIDLRKAESVDLEIRRGQEGGSPIAIHFDGSKLKVMDANAPLSAGKNGQLNLRIFIDHAVLEVFANQTIAFTKVMPPLDDDSTLEVSAAGGKAEARRIQAWPMKTIW